MRVACGNKHSFIFGTQTLAFAGISLGHLSACCGSNIVVLGSHSLCARFLLDAVAVAWPAPWLLTASVEALGPLPAGAVETHAVIASARRSDCGTSTCGAPTSAGPGLLPGLLPLLRGGASGSGGSASPLHQGFPIQGQLHCFFRPENGWGQSVCKK